MAQDELYQWIADQDCCAQPEPDETLKQMHERIQAEQRSAYAAKANRENVKLLIAAMELKP
jgi:hypothetical protein